MEEKIKELTDRIKAIDEAGVSVRGPKKTLEDPPRGEEGGRIVENTEKEELKKQIATLQRKPEEVKLSELYIILACEEPAKFRRKMAGMALPFNTRDKNYRIPIEEASRKYKFVSEKSPDEIKKEVDMIKRQREDRKMAKTKEGQQRYDRNRQILQRIHKHQVHERLGSIEGKDDPVVSNIKRTITVGSANAPQLVPIMAKNEVIPQKKKELTWDLLKDLTYNDIANTNNKEDEFLPANFLINEGEEEDNEFLKKLSKVGTKNSSPILKKNQIQAMCEDQGERRNLHPVNSV